MPSPPAPARDPGHAVHEAPVWCTAGVDSPLDRQGRLADALIVGWSGQGPGPAERHALAAIQSGGGACWIDATGNPAACDRLARAGAALLGPERVWRARAGAPEPGGAKLSCFMSRSSGAAAEMLFGIAPESFRMGASASLASSACLGAFARAAKLGRPARIEELIESLSLDSLAAQAEDGSLPEHARRGARACMSAADKERPLHEWILAGLAAPLSALMEAFRPILDDSEQALDWSRLGDPAGSLSIFELPDARSSASSRALSRLLAQATRAMPSSAPAGARSPRAQGSVAIKGGAIPRGWGIDPAAAGPRLARLAAEVDGWESFDSSKPADTANAFGSWCFGPEALDDPATASAALGLDAGRIGPMLASLAARRERDGLEASLGQGPEPAALNGARRI